jgi:hypothetical protein
MNVDLVRQARASGGMVFYAHPITINRNQLGTLGTGWPWTGHGRELPIDVALGSIDAFDVMSYSNKNRIELATWYDLLNHGFHLPASAGTDAAVNRTIDPPVGGYRVYARVGPGPFTYGAWLEAIRGGASWVTNGPLVREFKVGGAVLGKTVVVDSLPSFSLPVRVESSCQWPMERFNHRQRIEQTTFYPGEGRYHFVNTFASVYGSMAGGAQGLRSGRPGALLHDRHPALRAQAGMRGAGQAAVLLGWRSATGSTRSGRGRPAAGSPADRDTATARVTLARQIIVARTGVWPGAAPRPVDRGAGQSAVAGGRPAADVGRSGVAPPAAP